MSPNLYSFDSLFDWFQIASRAVLIKTIYKFIESANTYEELFSYIQNHAQSICDEFGSVVSIRVINMQEDKTWKLEVDSFGKVIPATEQMTMIESIIKVLNFPGQIRLRNPMNRLCLSFDYGHIGSSKYIAYI